MEEVKKDYKDLLEKLAEDGSKDLIWLLLGSLISADTIVSVKTCNNSITMLNELLDAIEKVSDSLYTKEEKDKIREFCNNGIKICNQDLEIFLENEKESNKSS